MSGVREDREKQIEELDSFIEMIRKRIEDVVSSLGWTYESISNESQTIITCPFNKGHRVQEKSLEQHLEKCQWKAEGYGEQDLPLSEPCPSVDATSSIKFDEQLQDDVLLRAKEKDPTMRTEISQNSRWNVLNIAAGVADRLIPRTSDRLMANFTGDERKAIYDYVVENTIKPDIGDDIADMNKMSQKDGGNQKTSLLELLAQERNLKRRRAKHRGVHTNKKSQVEILREVINQQMEMYEEYIADSKVKQEPKSPSKSEASSLDFRTSGDRRDHRSSSRTESKYQDRGSYPQNFLSTKRSPKREFGHERDRKRNRSGSRESESRRKHRSKHKRDKSKDRHRHEEGKERHRLREDKRSSVKEEVEDRSGRRKRHRSRDKKDKHRDRSRKREKSDDRHSRGRRK